MRIPDFESTATRDMFLDNRHITLSRSGESTHVLTIINTTLTYSVLGSQWARDSEERQRPVLVYRVSCNDLVSLHPSNADFLVST